MYDLRECILKKDNDKSAYNCIEQQIMTICLSLGKTYWKLFLENTIKTKANNSKFVEDKLEIESPVVKMAKEFYGISIDESVNKMNFENQELYLVNVELSKYPFTKHIEESGRHAFLVYGETGEDYLVNDSYYQISNYRLPKKFLEDGTERIFLVQQVDKNEIKDMNLLKQYILKKFSCTYYEAIKEINYMVLNDDITECRSAIISDKLQNIYAFLVKDALIISQFSEDEFEKQCGEILQQIAQQCKVIWYSIIKSILKLEKMDIQILTDKLKELEEVLYIEKKVKIEYCKMLAGKNSLKQSLYAQLQQYIGKDLRYECETRLVSEDHEGLAILYLLNYFEDINNVHELKFLQYRDKKTYKEYLLQFFRDILVDVSSCI